MDMTIDEMNGLLAKVKEVAKEAMREVLAETKVIQETGVELKDTRAPSWGLWPREAVTLEGSERESFNLP